MQRSLGDTSAGSLSVPVGMVALCMAALGAAAPNVQAQTVVSVGPFGSHAPNDAFSRAVAGLSVGLTSGPLGARVSAGVPVALRPAVDQQTARNAWSGDADVLLLAGNPGPAVFALAGVGATSPPGADGSARIVRNWSYGAGVSVPVAGVLELTAEGRFRRPFSGDATSLSTTAVPSSEARVGVAIRLGGRPAAHSSRTTRPGEMPLPEPLPGDASAARVLPTAERYLGVPYRWGGSSPNTGFDCSGFVQYVFAKHGTHLPRTSREIAYAGTKLPTSWSALRPGDLVLFAEPGARISHVAIYAGSYRIIHATASGGRVRYDDLATRRGRWFERRLVAARRVTPRSRGARLVRELVNGLPPTTLFGVELDPPDRAPQP